MWTDIDPSQFFVGLLESPVFAGMGHFFLSIGVCFFAVGTLLSMSKVHNFDEKVACLQRTLFLMGMLVAAPWFVRETKAGAYEVMYAAEMTPQQVTQRALGVALSCPETTNILSNMSKYLAAGKTDNNDAAKTEKAKADAKKGFIYKAAKLYFAGSPMVDTFIDASIDMNETMSSISPMKLLRAFMDSFSLLLYSVIKGAIMMVMLLILVLTMIVMGVVATFMGILQEFLLIMGTLILPVFIGMFAMPPNSPWQGTARNFCLNLLSTTLWPIVWVFGNFGTIALFNLCCSAAAPILNESTKINGLLDWNNAQQAAASASAQMQNYAADPTSLVNDATQAEFGIINSNITIVLMPIMGAVMLVIWVFYVYVKLPFSFNQLIIHGADMIGATAQGAMGAASSMVGTGAKIAATVATGGAAAGAMAAGGGAAGGMMSAAGGAGGTAGAAGGGAGVLNAIGGAMAQIGHHGSAMNIAGKVLGSFGNRPEPASGASPQSAIDNAANSVVPSAQRRG